MIFFSASNPMRGNYGASLCNLHYKPIDYNKSGHPAPGSKNIQLVYFEGGWKRRLLSKVSTILNDFRNLV